jgi:hypothetical protein
MFVGFNLAKTKGGSGKLGLSLLLDIKVLVLLN